MTGARYPGKERPKTTTSSGPPSYTVGDKTYTVHPLAKLFPLIFGDELERLVDDMRAHGLRRPILVTGETMIVDGRNRLRAAVQADIRPVFETLPPDANLFSVIVSENVLRRQMNKGQTGHGRRADTADAVSVCRPR